MNFKRKQFFTRIDRVVRGEIETLALAHTDRLARFGFDLLAHQCEHTDCTLVVMNSERLSPERELVEDLMTMVDSFSSRRYGLRHSRKALKEALEDDPQSPDTPQPHA